MYNERKRNMKNNLLEDIMMNRIVPKETLFCNLKKSIGYLLNDFLKVTYLEDIKCREMRELLNRKDLFSSIELYTVSEAIQAFYVDNKAWMDNYKKSILIDDSPNARSFTFEIISAFTATHDKSQKVRLSVVSQEGCDWTIEKDNIVVNVSCKKLGLSKQCLDYYSTCDELYKVIEKRYESVGNCYFGCVCQDKYSESVKEELLNTRNKFIFPNDGNYPKFILHKSPYVLSYLSKDNKTDSLCTNMYCKFSDKEQNRFNKLFSKAATNVKKHLSNQLNVIFIQVPVYISLEKAEEWLVGNFQDRYKEIAAVLINRNTIVHDDNQPEMSNEYKIIENPSSSFFGKIPTLEIVALFGKLAFADSVSVFSFKDEVYDMSDSYHYQRGTNKLVSEFLLI